MAPPLGIWRPCALDRCWGSGSRGSRSLGLAPKWGAEELGGYGLQKERDTGRNLGPRSGWEVKETVGEGRGQPRAWQLQALHWDG